MRLLTILGLVILIVFFALPIFNTSSIVPTGISEVEVGRFLGGVAGYWIRVVKIMF